MLPLAFLTQSQYGAAQVVAQRAIPKTTEVLVILTPKPGRTAQQVMAVIPAEIATVNSTSTEKIRQWVFRAAMAKASFLRRREDRRTNTSLMERNRCPLAKEQF